MVLPPVIPSEIHVVDKHLMWYEISVRGVLVTFKCHNSGKEVRWRKEVVHPAVNNVETSQIV